MQHCHITHFAQWINEYFVCIDFQTALGFATTQFNKTCVSLFISLQCCYHNDIATVATFSFLRAGRNGIDFRKPRLGECTAASSLCLCQHPPKVLHCSRNRISVSSGKGLNFITNDIVLLLKHDGNKNWFDFHTMRKVQM